MAVLLALALGTAWTWRAWADLQRLHLPDTDDVVRLQQVRDWLAGQRFADVTQYRLADGVPMHWSRLADLAPAALIRLLAPVLGSHMAEVTAVIAWPLALFAAALLLVARIARTLGGTSGGTALAATAALVAALGYPATTLFLPGRIDHHGLQMVLLLGATLSLLRAGSIAAGAAAGLLAAASLVIGLETAALFAMVGAIAIVDWVLGRDGAVARLRGLGLGALAGLLAGRLIFATTAWDYPACDGFTGEAWRAALAIAPAPLLLVAVDGRVRHVRARIAVTMLVVGASGAAALLLSPGCLAPYARIDPLLVRLWLSKVGEAQPLFAAPPAAAIGYAGLMLAGIGTSAWRLRASPARGWAVLLALQLAALAVTCDQLRGAYAGALLAAPGLAAAIGAARARGALHVVGAWAASAGMLYPLAADALTPPRPARASARGDCASPAMAAALDRLPPGLVIAPVDTGAWLLAATHRHFLAAPYHRDGAGDLAAYRFYLGDARAAEAVADRWHARYWLRCDAMPSPARATGLPGWRVTANLPDGATIWTRDDR